MLLRVAFPAQVLEEEFRRIQGYRTRAPRVPRKESTPGLTKSISARVLPESIFRYILVPAGYFDASPILILGEWDVPRYSRHRITKGIHEYYPYSRVWRSRYP